MVAGASPSVEVASDRVTVAVFDFVWNKLCVEDDGHVGDRKNGGARSPSYYTDHNDDTRCFALLAATEA